MLILAALLLAPGGAQQYGTKQGAVFHLQEEATTASVAAAFKVSEPEVGQLLHAVQMDKQAMMRAAKTILGLPVSGLLAQGDVPGRLVTVQGEAILRAQESISEMPAFNDVMRAHMGGTWQKLANESILPAVELHQLRCLQGKPKGTLIGLNNGACLDGQEPLLGFGRSALL